MKKKEKVRESRAHISTDACFEDNPLDYHIAVVGPSNHGSTVVNTGNVHGAGGVSFDMMRFIMQEVLKAIKGKHVIGKSSNKTGYVYAHCAGIELNQFLSSMWIMDSRATHHMTCEADLLLHKRKLDKSVKIGLLDGYCNYVTEMGDIALSDGIILKHVLFAPRFIHNLLSVVKYWLILD
ncbi:hypothetical protein BVRB_9g212940 [Beta vulgaris subsp. vulgaris]|nr:hypothetical protein BVRB_9g212940 [Beta vulgaris subsp. vulgaris]